jgi:acylphosphatase
VPETVTVRLRITGRVQGVGYRDWAARTAEKLGLAGWVRNLSDGSVEALAQGSEAVIASFESACRKGPRLARVVEVRSIPAPRFAGTDFQIAPTADPT